MSLQQSHPLSTNESSGSALNQSIVLAIGMLHGSQMQQSDDFDIDTENVTYIRIETAYQRIGMGLLTIADVKGKIYAHGTELGKTYTLTKVEYSAAPIGPWTEATILSSDGLYSWPGTASVPGTAYQVPVRIQEYTETQLYWRITVSYA